MSKTKVIKADVAASFKTLKQSEVQVWYYDLDGEVWYYEDSFDNIDVADRYVRDSSVPHLFVTINIPAMTIGEQKK